MGKSKNYPIDHSDILGDPLGDVAEIAIPDPDPLAGHAKDPPKGPPIDTSIGYGKPPKKHQFKKGQSGNPKGRPKGTKNESTILKSLLLDRKIRIREGGRVRSVPVLEGILLRFTEDSLKGNTKSASFLLNRYGQQVSGEIERPEIDQDDREIIEAFVRKTQNSHKERKE